MRKLIVLTLIVAMSASSLAQEVRKAPRFEQPLQRSAGWTGADGTYSLKLGPDSTLWCFSDTFFGEVVEGRREGFKMVNNSLVLQTGKNYSFLKAPSFRPPDGKGWFWLLDGVHSKGDLGLLLGQFESAPGGAFGFKQVGLWHAKFVLRGSTSAVLEYTKLPHFVSEENNLTSFGSAIYEGPVWTYVLGTRDRNKKREALLARVPRGQLASAGAWRFYDGARWARNAREAKALFVGCSMESSLFPTRDGGFLYFGGRGNFPKGEVAVRYSSKITGPWGPQEHVLTPPECKEQIFAYNAKAHPQLSQNGEILFSYNVNTLDLKQVIDDADIYRPRFYWWRPKNKGWLPLGTQSRK